MFICFIWFIFFSRLLLWQLSGPKGGILLWVFASWQVRAILYQHILIKKSIGNIRTAFRVSLGRWLCAAALLRWRHHGTHTLVHMSVPPQRKIQLPFSWFKHKTKRVFKRCHLILMGRAGSIKGLSVSHASPDWVSSPLNHTLHVCAHFTVCLGWGNVLWPQSARSATLTECFRTG